MEINREKFSKAEKKAEVANSLRAFISVNLVDIKTKIATLLGLIGRNEIFDEYTKHDISHVDRMLDSLESLIPDSTKEKMTTADWLLIVLSIYFHDLGMLVTKKEYEGRMNSKDFCKFREEYISNVYNANSLKSLSPDKSERFIYQEYVRRHHGNRVYDWILDENNHIYDSNVTTVVMEIVKDFPPVFKNDLAIVCASHSLDDLDDFSKYKIQQAYGGTPQEKANVFYAALILRTADLIHITCDRTPTTEYRIISPTNPTSQEEWAKQGAISSIIPKIAEDEDGNKDIHKQSDTLEVNAYFEKENGFFSLIEYLNYVKVQLRNNNRINEIAKKRFASQYDFPWKDIDDSTIQTKNFERRQLSFTIDQNKVLGLLVGETLYNNLSVSLRELAQNAIDAVKVRKYELYEKISSVGTETYQPKIKVSWNSSARELIISDNGTGMNLDIIENHLLKVGSSRYQDPKFLKEHPGYNPISRFGIGLLTCFLIADDVDILTNMTQGEKPLLLKIRNVYGKYLLKHGVEKDSNLSLIDDVGTSIKLKVRPDIEDFNPENILRHWIIIPQCIFVYTENNDVEKIIGYDSPKQLMEEFISKINQQSESIQYKAVQYDSDGIELCILLKYNPFFKEWSMVDMNNIFDINVHSVLPIGNSIEGIRIDTNTPGFNNNRFIAFANMIGENAPKTNVARSNINSNSIKKTSEIIYSLYLKNILTEQETLCNDFSITWAAEETEWMLSTFLGSEIHDRNIDFSDKDVFIGKLCEKPLVLIEQEQIRKFRSINDIKEYGHFWTIESEAFDSANRLLKEINSNNSAISLLSNLYSNDAKLEDVDILLSKRKTFNIIDEILLTEFQITDIHIFKEQRRLDIKWEKVSSQSNLWRHICPKRDMDYRDRSSYFIQTEEQAFNKYFEYDAIRSKYGIIFLYTSPIAKFLNKCLKKLNIDNDIDLSIISHLCKFIEKALNQEIRLSDWEQQIEQIFERLDNPRHYRLIFEKVHKEQLIDMCNECKFNIYDTSKWYRFNKDLQSHDLYYNYYRWR